MKKLIKAFNKTKEKQNCNFGPAVNSPLNLNSSEERLTCVEKYKSFNFDATCQSSEKIKQGEFLRENDSNINGDEFFPSTPSFSTDSPSVHPLLSYVQTVSEKSDTSYSVSAHNNVSNNFSGSLHESEKSKLKNSSKNTYVINIANSKHFHIGSLTNVYSSDCKNNCQVLEKNNSQLEINELLKSKDSLTDDIIKLIAFNFENDWKFFATKLGFEEDVIIELESRFPHVTFIVYDLLKRMVEKDLNTKLGYLAGILLENYQFNVLKKLLLHKNSS